MTITERFTLENFKPQENSKSGLYNPFDTVIRFGGVVCREYDVDVNTMQSYCHVHSKECRNSSLGKSLTLYMVDGKIKMFCTIHEMEHVLLTRFTKSGYLVTDQFHP